MINTEITDVSDILHFFPTEQSAIDHLTAIRWNGTILSPFDAQSKVYKCKGNRYKCVNTGKYFNVKTNTMFHASNIPLRTWFCAIHLFKKEKISSPKLGKRLGVSQKSAWYMFKRMSVCEDMEWFKKHEISILLQKVINE